MKSKILILALALALAPAMLPATSIAQHAGHSRYAGEAPRAIKSLSDEDIAELRRGGGWGLARAAELNGVPGPAHLLELKSELELSADQVVSITAIFEAMRGAAIAEGARLIEAERTLEAAFRARRVTDEDLRTMLAAIEHSRSRLRYIHLAAHLTTPPLLSEAQLRRYTALRGYTANPCDDVPAGHDPVLWRQHNGCK